MLNEPFVVPACLVLRALEGIETQVEDFRYAENDERLGPRDPGASCLGGRRIMPRKLFILIFVAVTVLILTGTGRADFLNSLFGMTITATSSPMITTFFIVSAIQKPPPSVPRSSRIPSEKFPPGAPRGWNSAPLC